MARAHYLLGEAVEGRLELVAGASDDSPLSTAAYRNALEWVASPEELMDWDSLPAAARGGFVAGFWASRDVASGRPDGARLVEHYARLEFALREFRSVVPQSGKQKFPGVAMTIDYTVDEFLTRFANEYMAGDAPETVATLNRLEGDQRTLGIGVPFRAFRVDAILYG